MSLSRLQELTTLTEATKAQAPAASKRNAYKDFGGIQSVVDDCLADLKDKIGKAGQLAELIKSSGASKLDTVKDSNGKNVLNQIIALTTEYTKAIPKLMMEAEMLVGQVQEGSEVEGDVLNEDLLNEASSDYDDSAEFTDEFFGISSDVQKMKSKMKNPRWMKWMKSTDSNFGTDTVSPARSAITAVNSLSTAIADIEAEFDKADE